jgi:hypothetical protein
MYSNLIYPVLGFLISFSPTTLIYRIDKYLNTSEVPHILGAFGGIASYNSPHIVFQYLVDLSFS